MKKKKEKDKKKSNKNKTAKLGKATIDNTAAKTAADPAKPTKKSKPPVKAVMMISTHGYVAADPPLGAPDTGGQVVFVIELAKKLGLFGYKVDIWTRQFEDQPETEVVDKNVRILRSPCGGDEFITKEYLYQNIPEWVRNTLERMEEEGLQYNFIDSHYWDAGVAGQMISNEVNIPHVHTPHSLGAWKKDQMLADYPDDEASFEEKYNFTARIKNETILYRSCDLIIATTPIQVDKIEKDYNIPRKRIRMIPPGYDDNRFFPVGESSRIPVRERLGISGKTVFAVSRLAENKGLDLLVESFHLLNQRMPEARLLLAIGHEDRSASEEAIYQQLLELCAKYNIKDSVDIIGFIPDEDLPDYYRGADLFALSSRYEPFGMTAVEAMASGTPAIVTVHGGLCRILDYGLNALFADPFDKEDLAITMYKAFKYKDLHKRLSERGAQIARERFTWTGIAQQLLNAVDSKTNAFDSIHVRPTEEL